MGIKKLEYDEAMLVENIMTKINELVEEVEDQNQRINRIWKFLRMRETREIKKEE
jgi:hypothetical protein